MKKRLPKTLFVLFVTLLCILIPAYDVMTAYSAMINNALNIQSYRVVESDIAADYDSEYFKAAQQKVQWYTWRGTRKNCGRNERPGQTRRWKHSRGLGRWKPCSSARCS